MEKNLKEDHLSLIQAQLQYLRRRIQELEAENAKLTHQLLNCACDKGLKSDNLNGIHPVKEGMEFDKSGVKMASKEVLPEKYSVSVSIANLPKRYVALKVMYFGSRFYGFASEAQMDPTVESELFSALQKTRLISGDKKEVQYSRCGRTDKGVSSVGQVISLFLRSNFRETVQSNECFEGEIDYVKTLNRVLPNDIRITGWSPAPIGFSARFSCLSREYRYFFWGGNLNIKEMETAGNKFIGEHDFRNFCKMDAANVQNYRRHITLFEILPCTERFDEDQLWVVKVRGSAFLWHQIRCMVAVLFLIGQGLESPNVIDELLDIERTPRKPQYTMAHETPLVLYSCKFESLSFMCSSDANQALQSHLEKQCRDYKLQGAIFHEALSNPCPLLHENQERVKKQPRHIPLMSRPTEPSFDERRAKLSARFVGQDQHPEPILP